jgi:hypothetical protein
LPALAKLHKLRAMILTLHRKWLNTETPTTIGELYVNGAFFCFTLEDVIRPEGVKIKHETAIPAGKYQVVIAWSNRFQKHMPRLIDVPMFDGILIHSGNTNAHTSGCILVGRKRGEASIAESRAAFAALFNVIARAALTEKVWIEIHNPVSFRITAPSRHFESEKGITAYPERQKSSHEAGKWQKPAFAASSIPDIPLSAPVKVPTQARTQPSESLKTGNTLPVSLVTIQTACQVFLQQNGQKLLLWLTLSILIALVIYEFGPKLKRKVRL